MDSTIIIYIGSEVKTRIPCKVLQYSILKHAKNPERIQFIVEEQESWTKNPKLGLGTGFSLMRWKIPELLQYQGKALYIDADQLFFSDVEELWNFPETTGRTGISCWTTYQADKWFDTPQPNTSVMLIDCQIAKSHWWSFDQIVEYLKQDVQRKRYVEVMHALHLTQRPGTLPVFWNHLNEYVPNWTRNIHYTKEPEQPWYCPSHKHAKLWQKSLKEAIRYNHVTVDEVREAVAQFRPHTKKERGTGMHPKWLELIK